MASHRSNKQNMTPNQTDMTPAEIKAELVRKGITQRDIARALSVNHLTLHRVLHGTVPSDRIREAIANAIGLTAAQVWPSLYRNGLPRKPGRPAPGQKAA